MRPRSPELTEIVRRTLAATRVPALLGAREAVVLERIARGGGEACGYYCRRVADLEILERELRAGSVVSFYFDGRFRWDTDSPAFRAEVKAIAAAQHGAFIGAVEPDGVHVALMWDLTDVDDRELAPSTRLFYGEFPGRDDDGVHAVTFQVPDEDGVVRPHPH